MDTSPLLHFEAFIASLLVLVITGVKMYTTTYVPRTDMRVIARIKDQMFHNFISEYNIVS